MTEVIIVGAGGHAAELDDYIAYNNKLSDRAELKVIGFLDDDPDSYIRYRFSGPYLGKISDHKVLKKQVYLMGIANLKYRRSIINKIVSNGGVFLTFVHKSAFVSDSAIIGEGTIIGPNVNVGPNVKIGKNNLINSRSSLGHDTVVGNYNFVSPNVCFSGFTVVGDENLFGINSASIPGIHVGDRNKIAAGMVLDQNISNESVVFYRFKERIIAVPK